MNAEDQNSEKKDHNEAASDYSDDPESMKVKF